MSSEPVFLGSPLFEEIDDMWNNENMDQDSVVNEPVKPVKEEEEEQHEDLKSSSKEEKERAVRELISSIEKGDIAMDDDDVADPDYTPKEVKETSLAARRSSRKRHREPSADPQPSQDGARIKQSRISDRVLKTPDGKKKTTKLYAHSKPFADPKVEKARLNAINAKLNRDRKKKERDALTSEVVTLRAHNEQLEDEKTDAEKRAEAAEMEVQRIREILRRSGLESMIAKCTVEHASARDRESCSICGLESNPVASPSSSEPSIAMPPLSLEEQPEAPGAMVALADASGDDNDNALYAALGADGAGSASSVDLLELLNQMSGC